MKNILFALALGLVGCQVKTLKQVPVIVNSLPSKQTALKASNIQTLDSVDIDYQFDGDFEVYYFVENPFYLDSSFSVPEKVNHTFPKKGFYLVNNQHELSIYNDSLLGNKLYLVNTSDSLITLDAIDGRLYMVAEALDEYQHWSPITYITSSDCGNSYHTVELASNEFWSFDVPVFKGTFKTKMRYRLTMNKGYSIVSNEVVAYLNKGQFNTQSRKARI